MQTMTIVKKTQGLGWSLETANVSVKAKPRRPYTPYNLFYLLERELMVQEPNKSTVTNLSAPLHCYLEPEDDLEMPARYRGIVMPPRWYDPNRKEKRKHRRTHGKISFKELTDNISKNWATIDEESKNYCTILSDIGRRKYKQNMSRYIASKKIMELQQERSVMTTGRDCIGGKVGTPPRTKAPQSLPPPVIQTVTPDRPHSVQSCDRHAHKLQPPVVTPPYNLYANRRPIYYPSIPYFGQVGAPPPLPSPPPPMPSHRSPHYRHHGPRAPPPMPPPMPTSSFAHYGRYPQYHAHRNGITYYGEYTQRHRHARESSHPGYNYYQHQERQPHPHAQTAAAPALPEAAPHWSQDAHQGTAENQMSSGHLSIKTDKEYRDYLLSLREKMHANDKSTDDNIVSSRPNDVSPNEDQKVHPTMSFGSIESNHLQLNLSRDSFTGYNHKQHQEVGGDPRKGTEDDESILGLLREDLIPFDTNDGIPFQLSWEDVQL